jgi:hypothetical protein
MPNWHALPYELKLQLYHDLIDAVLRAGPQRLFLPEPSSTIMHGTYDFLLVAPELQQDTLELVEKVLVIDTRGSGTRQEYKLSPIQLRGPQWCWTRSKERVEQSKQVILKEVKHDIKLRARYARRMEKKRALRMAAMKEEDSSDDY